MNKYLILLLLMINFSIPVFATCSITGGACTATSNWETPPLDKRLVPNNLEELQKPDAFQPSYVTPYYDLLINTEQNTSSLPPENNYNSNCQFGVCMPGHSTGAGAEIAE